VAFNLLTPFSRSESVLSGPFSQHLPVTLAFPLTRLLFVIFHIPSPLCFPPLRVSRDPLLLDSNLGSSSFLSFPSSIPRVPLEVPPRLRFLTSALYENRLPQKHVPLFSFRWLTSFASRFFGLRPSVRFWYFSLRPPFCGQHRGEVPVLSPWTFLIPF